VEEAIEPLRELNCAVLGSPAQMEISAIEEPLTANEVLSFSDKYLSGDNKGMSSAKRRIPADITPKLAEQIEDFTRRTFTALDGYGVCRVDSLYNPQTETLYVNEANTIPGSLSFYLFEPKGKTFTQLVDGLLQQALARYREQQKLIYTYDSNILSQGGFKGKKG
jgi:D-alanine-D-alanine ligase